MKHTLAAAFAALLALPAPSFAHDATIHIVEPYVRAMPGGMSGAAFMVIQNTGDQDDRLVAAASDVARRVELHTHKEDAQGVMRMVEIEGGIAVPAGASHALDRGADHVMFMGLTRSLAEGDLVSVTLTFERAGDMTLEIPVDNGRQPFGAMQGHGHGAGHGGGHGQKHGN